MSTNPTPPDESKLTERCTVLRGWVESPGCGILALAYDDLLAQKVEHSLIVRMGGAGARLIGKLKWETRAVFSAPDGQVRSIGARGRVATIGATLSVESIATDLDRPGVVGLVRDGTFCAPDTCYALALDARLFQWGGGGGWRMIVAPRDDVGLHRIAQGAVGAGDLLAASIDGRVFHLEGGQWVDIGLPSSAIVNYIWRMPDGQFLACGLGGLLVRGSPGRAVILEHDYGFENFWSICELSGQVYVSSLSHLYQLLPSGKLQRVDPLGAASYHLLHATRDVLWSIGAKDVLELNQGQWSRIL